MHIKPILATRITKAGRWLR